MDVQEVYRDPNFQGLPKEEKRKVLMTVLPTDENFMALPGLEKTKTIMALQEPPPEKRPEWSELPGNIPGGAWNLVKFAGQTLASPFQEGGGEFGKMMQGLGTAFRASALPVIGEPVDPEAEAARTALVQPITESIENPAGIPERVRNYVIKHPVEAGMWASGGLGLGGYGAKVAGLPRAAAALSKAAEVTNPVGLAAKATKMVVKPVIKGVGTLAKETVGAATGAGPGFVEEAVKGGGAFQKAMRGDVTGEEIVDNAKAALQRVRNARGEAYVKQLEQIQADPNELLSVRKSLNKKIGNLASSDRFDIKPYVDEAGKLQVDFSTSTIVEHQNVVKRAIEDVANWTDNTPKGLDTLKKRLSTYIDQTGRDTPAKAFVTQLEQNLSNGLKSAIPEYAKMTKGYADASTLIKDIESNLMLRKEGMTGRITADQTLRRLTSALREKFEMRKDLLQALGTQAGEDMIGEVAGYAGQQIIPHGLVGKLGAGAGAYYFGMFNPKLWPLLAASSPRVVGEFLNAYGKASKGMKGLVSGVAESGVRGVSGLEKGAPYGIPQPIGEIEPGTVFPEAWPMPGPQTETPLKNPPTVYQEPQAAGLPVPTDEWFSVQSPPKPAQLDWWRGSGAQGVTGLPIPEGPAALPDAVGFQLKDLPQQLKTILRKPEPAGRMKLVWDSNEALSTGKGLQDLPGELKKTMGLTPTLEREIMSLTEETSGKGYNPGPVHEAINETVGGIIRSKGRIDDFGEVRNIIRRRFPGRSGGPGEEIREGGIPGEERGLGKKKEMIETPKPEDGKLYHGSSVPLENLKPGTDGGIHIGTKSQAEMRNSKYVYEVETDARKFKRERDSGGDWKSKIEKAKKGGYEGIVYLNRYEGIDRDAYLKLLDQGWTGEKLDALSDREFKKLLPDMKDSYIVFSTDNVKLLPNQSTPPKEGGLKKR